MHWNALIIQMFKVHSSSSQAHNRRLTAAKADQIVTARFKDMIALVDLFANAWGWRVATQYVFFLKQELVPFAPRVSVVQC